MSIAPLYFGQVARQAGHWSARFLEAWQAFERAHGRKVRAKEIADALGVSDGLVSQWQGRDDPPPHPNIIRISEVCGVDPGWLAYGELSKAPMPRPTITHPDGRPWPIQPGPVQPQEPEIETTANAPSEKPDLMVSRSAEDPIVTQAKEIVRRANAEEAEKKASKPSKPQTPKKRRHGS